MSSRWTCPKGHETDALAAPSVCPVCGDAALIHNSVNGTRHQATLDAPLAPATPAFTQTINAPDELYANRPEPAKSRTSTPRIEVPGYEILGELGRGGMGVVYKAKQTKLNRFVAIKMILAAEHAGISDLGRFQIEAEAVAQLQHPNIVQIYEVGEVKGRPYFSLEFVDGGSLSQKLQQQPQSARSSAVLLEALARAIAAAHAMGIIHRDLKPANVLLAKISMGSSTAHTLSSLAMRAQQPFGIPKITDFGLAKRIEGGTGNTQSGSILGTPSYMAPEQAAGNIKEIGPRSDIYALGAILYEMLTGRPPFLADSPFETIMQVMRDEPVPPRTLQPKLPRDIEIITLKCLEKNQAKRYQTADELADDLRRFVEGEPISARAATQAERVRKWIKRHPAASGLMAVAAAAIAAMVAGAWIYHDKVNAALSLAEQERDKLTVEQQAGLQRTIRLMVSNGTQHLNQKDYLRSLPWFTEAMRLENGAADREEMHRVRLASVLRNCPRLTRAWFHDGRVNDVTFSPDGASVLSASADGTASINLIDDLTNEPAMVFRHPGPVLRARYSSTNKHVVTVCSDSAARLWDVKTGKMIAEPLRHTAAVTGAFFSPDGLRVLTTSADRTARTWDVLTGEASPIVFKHGAAVLYAEYSPDGRWIVTAGEDGAARVWDADTGEPVSPVLEHQGPIVRAHFNPQGNQVLTASKDQTFRIWDADNGKGITPFIRHLTPLTDAEFSPNGMDVVTTSTDGIGRVWSLELSNQRTDSIRHDSPITDVIFSPDGRLLATGGDDNTARIWSVVLGEPMAPPLRHNGSVTCVVFNKDGSALLTASQDGLVRLWDVSRARHETFLEAAGGPTQRVVYSFNRRRRLKIDPDGSALVIDAASGEAIGPPLRHQGAILAADFSPDGTRVLTASVDRSARVWNPLTGEAIGAAMRHGSDVTCAVFNPDGKRIATGSEDNTARIWNAETGLPITPPLRHLASVKKLIFSPDGRCLLSLAGSGLARVWDAANGEDLAPPMKPSGWIKQVLGSSETSVGWDLPPDPRDVTRLLTLGKWLSAHEVDKEGNLVPIDSDSLFEIWNKMRTLYPEELVRHTDQTPWHRQGAVLAEENREGFAAVFHLTFLINDEKSPRPRSQLLTRRGQAYAIQGQWQAAARDFKSAIAEGLDDDSALIDNALTQLAAGNLKEYQEACRSLLTYCGESANATSVSRTAMPCLLGTLSPELTESLDRLIRRANLEGQQANCLQLVRGARQTRAMKSEEAVRLLTDAHILGEGIDTPRAWLFLTLAELQSGHMEEAQRWLRQANIWIDRRGPDLTWQQRLELKMLRDECATALMKK